MRLRTGEVLGCRVGEALAQAVALGSRAVRVPPGLLLPAADTLLLPLPLATGLPVPPPSPCCRDTEGALLAVPPTPSTRPEAAAAPAPPRLALPLRELLTVLLPWGLWLPCPLAVPDSVPLPALLAVPHPAAAVALSPALPVAAAALAEAPLLALPAALPVPAPALPVAPAPGLPEAGSCVREGVGLAAGDTEAEAEWLVEALTLVLPLPVLEAAALPVLDRDPHLPPEVPVAPLGLPVAARERERAPLPEPVRLPCSPLPLACTEPVALPLPWAPEAVGKGEADGGVGLALPAP